jgi:hypothetical protein
MRVRPSLTHTGVPTGVTRSHTRHYAKKNVLICSFICDIVNWILNVIAHQEIESINLKKNPSTLNLIDQIRKIFLLDLKISYILKHFISYFETFCFILLETLSVLFWNIFSTYKNRTKCFIFRHFLCPTIDFK